MGGHNINNLKYADDIVLIAQSEETLQYMQQTKEQASENKGLALNISKTDTVTLSKNPKAPTIKYKVAVCQSKKLINRNTWVTCWHQMESAFLKKGRITAVKITLKRPSSVMTNKNIIMNTKFRIIQTHMWLVLLYGREYCTIINSMRKRMEPAKIWFLRRILKVSWTEKNSNQEVLEMTNMERSLIKTI